MIEKILVAGGAGFIGSHLVNFLIKKNISVTVFDNFSSGLRSNLPSHDLLEIYECDISENLPELNYDFDIIYNLASPACPSIFESNPEEVLNANDLGTRNLLNIAKVKDVKFVYTSSSEIYGMQKNATQIKETELAHLYSLTSRSCYVAAKRYAEELAITYRKKYDIDTRIIRLFNVYGPKMDQKESIYGRVIPNFLKAALNNKNLVVNGDGTQFRSFCWIDDIIEALWLVGKRKNFPLKVMNVGKAEPIRIIDLAKEIIKLTNSQSEITFQQREIDDTLWRCPDIQLAKKTLNWEPKTSLKDGLQKLIEYYRNGS